MPAVAAKPPVLSTNTILVVSGLLAAFVVILILSDRRSERRHRRVDRLVQRMSDDPSVRDRMLAEVYVSTAEYRGDSQEVL